VPSLHAPDYGAPVTRTTVFGAGAMGTAVAMHAARRGHDVALWGSSHDSWAFQHLVADRQHPLLPEHLPGTVRLCGPEELEAAAEGAQFLVLGAALFGVFNLVGPGAVPLHVAIRETGSQKLPLPESLARPVINQLFRWGVYPFPPRAIDVACDKRLSIDPDGWFGRRVLRQQAIQMEQKRGFACAVRAQ